jgi:hypothetical protein
MRFARGSLPGTVPKPSVDGAGSRMGDRATLGRAVTGSGLRLASGAMNVVVDLNLLFPVCSGKATGAESPHCQ